MNEWYNTVKNNITPTNIEKTMAYDCKTNEGWSKYISISYYINNEFEKQNNIQINDLMRIKDKFNNDESIIEEINEIEEEVKKIK